MSKLADDTLIALKTGDTKARQEALLVIAEMAAVNRISGFKSDIFPEANKEILTWPELEKLQESAIRFIEEHPNDSNIISAFWALGKFRNKTLESAYARWLECYLESATRPAKIVGQILVSMNDSGIKTISGGSYSFDDYGKNLSDAVSYLKQNKIS